jgi:hypothetical protein
MYWSFSVFDYTYFMHCRFFRSLNENNLKRNIFYQQKREFNNFTSSYCNVGTLGKKLEIKRKLNMN